MNKTQLLQRMEYSAKAYRNIQPNEPGQRLIYINSKSTGVQCYLRSSEGLLQITFRGTDSCQDWLTDFRFWKKTIPYGNTASKIRVHSGFIDAYKSDEVRGVIHRYIDDTVNKVLIMGHSYGAALSVLCAVDLQYNFPHKDYEVTLFGCPRVGNKAFQKSYNKRVFKTFRVENGNDIVTKIPFALFGFRHVGMRIPVGHYRVLGILSFHQHEPGEYYRNILLKTICS